MSPRNKRIRRIGSPPVLKGFQPIGLHHKQRKDVSILYEEYEALRLIHYSGFRQDEASKIMNVSRPTFTRIYNSCLKKLAKALAEGNRILFEGGDVEFDKQWYRCNDCVTVFHHHDEEHQECISCDSENIEHINQSIRDWKKALKNIPSNEDHHPAPQEYCICPSCNYEEIRKSGVPCFSLVCPECNTPLLRKGM